MNAPTVAAPAVRHHFAKTMSDPVSIPKAGIERAVEILRSHRLFRYGEDTGGLSEVAHLEAEFAQYTGRPYAVAVNSCGCSLFLALKALGVEPGAPVLCNAFTLAPVPGAIAHAGARGVLVDITPALTIDLDYLALKIDRSGARVLLLSHMRGHVGDMRALMALCQERGVAVVEDCAHTLNAYWDGQMVGTFGQIACFSAQTFKHINSGEGGLVVTDNAHWAAKITVMSGSYMMYGQHGAGPDLHHFEAIRDQTPNFSMRMSNLVAALLRPQLPLLETWTQQWNRSYHQLEAGLSNLAGLGTIPRDQRERYVGSSIQFTAAGLSPEAIRAFVADAAAHGVFLKWFGAPRTAGFTSRYDQWGYIADKPPLTRADELLATLLDMRIAVDFDRADCELITTVLQESLAAVGGGHREPLRG
ncbi:MAG: DegT/DnrJ/EryC1/StrS family aminotransferase [Candidatus Competibacterales bacterium]